MAKAQVVKREIEYMLTLTEMEAAVLMSLIGGYVAGDMDGPRKLISEVYNALELAKVPDIELNVTITKHCININK